jgi:mono/diheme cytochrome c family protein
METAASSAKAVPVLAGAVIGIMVFSGLNIWFGIPFIPTTDDLPTVWKQPPASAAVAVAEPTGPTDPGEQTFQTVCAACHQANAQGLPGAFPPLAGSDWVASDPETPIRVLIAGLSGPITVKGAQFNSMMPPPPGLDDEKIAAVLTYVRSHFENKASAVTKEQVAAVRTSVGNHAAKPFTAEELQAQRPAAAAPAATP